MIFIISLVLVPVMLTSVAGKIDNPNGDYSVNEDFTNIHRGFIFTNGDLGGFGELDTYQFKLKADKEYYFRILIDYQYGSSVGVILSNNDAVELKAEAGSWDSDDPKNMRKIVFRYTPDGGNYTFTVWKLDIYDVEDFKYEIYINLAGIAGYWWMLLCGFIVFIIIIWVIAAMTRKSKRSKKKSKRR